MQKDLKIGLLLGLVFASALAIYLATRSGVSIRSRLDESFLEELAKEIPDETFELKLDSGIDVPEKPKEPVRQKQQVKPLTPEKAPEKVRYHIVRKGETLSGLAKLYYGQAAKSQKIFNTNRNTVKNQNTLRPGTRLIIPE